MGKSFELLRKHLHSVVACIIIGAHFLLLICFFEPAYSTPDANGYFKQGQLIADHGRTWRQAESPVQYFGIHWMEAQGDRIYSRYPPGLPLLIAFPYKLFGPDAGILVNTILTSLTLFGLYYLCRMWIGRGWALAAIAAMACNPIINTDALTGDAHAAAAFFLVWGLVFLARWAKTLSLAPALLAGFLLGFIPAIRYPEALFGFGIATFIVLHLKTDRRAWSGAAAAVMGAAIPIAGLMVHNYLAFGAVWKTAYSLTKEQTGFSSDFFFQNLIPYLQNMLFHGAGLLWLFGLAGLGLVCMNRQTRRQGILIAVLVLPITLLYVSYFFMLDDHPFSTLRFLLPTFYLYAIAAVWGLKLVGERWKYAAVATAATLLVINALWGAPRSLIAMITLKDADAALAAVEEVAREHVKPGAIVIAPSHIQQHLDYYGRWRLMDACVIEGLPMATQYIMNTKFGYAKEPDKDGKWPILFLGDRKEDKMLMIISQDIRRKIKIQEYTALAGGDAPQLLYKELSRWNRPGSDLYWIGKTDNIKKRVPPGDRLTVVCEIEPPPLMFSKLGKLLPNHTTELRQLNDTLWKGLLRLDQFVANPMGISWLMHHDGGLELVKWTRYVDP